MKFEKRMLGKCNLLLSPLGLGSGFFFRHSQAELDALIHLALENGINYIETAECYGDAEEKIGKSLKSSSVESYVFSKCGHKDDHEQPAWTRKELTESIERSLKRLQVECIDLMQLHSCNKGILKKGDCIEVLQKAKKEGKIRYMGYSGDGAEALYAIKTGAFDTIMTSLGLADQESIDLLLPESRENKLGILAKRPLSNAMWSSNTDVLSAKRSLWQRLKQYNLERVKHRLRRLLAGNQPMPPFYSERFAELEYFKLLQEMDLAEIALRFTLSIPGVHSAVVGTTSKENLLKNLRSIEKGELEPELYRKIRERWQLVAKKHWTARR
ncbi:MAG: aldo/keto reductase [Candidatus Obscuribacterales bacterium]|nr:aldo/keto reductase [Candidatus Obscuribacterales bacterium]